MMRSPLSAIAIAITVAILGCVQISANAEAHRTTTVAPEFVPSLIQAMQGQADRSPRAKELHRYLGTIHMVLQQDEEAIREFTQVVRMDPQNADAHHNLEVLYTQERHRKEALKEAREAVLLEPNSAIFRLRCGLALWEMEEKEASIRELHIAAQLDTTLYEPHCYLAEYLGKTNHPADEAEAEAREAVRLDPKAALAYTYLGRALIRKNDYANAVAAVRTAAALEPTWEYPHYVLSKMFTQMKRLQDSVAEGRKAVERAPNEAYVHVQMGVALANMGKIAEARANWKRTLAIDPTDDSADDARMLLDKYPVK